MNNHVKRFIEENIDLIEKEDWRGVFLSWYLHYSAVELYTDTRNFREFIEVMEAAYPDFAVESQDIRQDVLRDRMEMYINDCVQAGREQIRYTSCIESLLSTFGEHEYFLKQLFKQAAKNCGFNVSSNYIIEEN